MGITTGCTDPDNMRWRFRARLLGSGHGQWRPVNVLVQCCKRLLWRTSVDPLDSERPVLSLQPPNRKVSPSEILVVVDEVAIDQGTTDSANHRHRLRCNLLSNHNTKPF